MENSSKALIIAAAIILAIILVSLTTYVANKNTGIIKETVDSADLDIKNEKYIMYEGIQNGSNIKKLLRIAAEDNEVINESESLIDECVGIKSNSSKIIKKLKDKTLETTLTGGEEYGVVYPENIYALIDCINIKDKFDVSFNYSKRTGNISEILINDI